jgi:uncharacterized protein
MLGLVLAVSVTSVPFLLVDNRMVVQATIDGVPGFSMIVDTGTTGVVITPRVAARLHLAPHAAGAVVGAGSKRQQAGLARTRGVFVGSWALGAQNVLILDLGLIQHALHFPHLDGVIGYDALGANALRVDMDHDALTLSSHPIAAPAVAHLAAFTERSGVLRVEGAIDGVHGDLVLDTGDRSSLTAYQPFGLRDGFDAITPRVDNVITGYGIGGVIRGDLFGSTLDVFGYSIPNVVTRLPLGNAGIFSTAPEEGSIGNGLLRNFDFIFDRVQHELAIWPAHINATAVTFDPPSAPPLPRHAVLGAVLADGKNGTSITRVIPGSAAALAGLVAGDTLTSIDGVPTPNTVAFLSEMHHLHAGQQVEIGVVRSGVAQQRGIVLGTPPNESDPNVTTIYGAVEVDGSLRRTLVTVPNNVTGRLPAVLVLGGIGCYSVDLASNAQDAYMLLTHAISRAGFVTMRLEKSGVGDSQGPPCNQVDFAAEERGYAAALQVLRNDPLVDASRIYLLGHSIGTVEAPRLAARQPVAGIIVAESVGRDWPEYEVRNLRRQLELSGESPSDVDTALLEKQQCLVRLLLEDQLEAEIERSIPSCKTHNGVYPVAASYMQQVAPLDIIGVWAKVNVPVLAIYGRSDFVTEQADHQRIVDVVNAAHPSSATFVAIDGMDHYFSKQASPQAALEASLKGSPRIYDDDLSIAVIRWLRQTAFEMR